MDVLAVNMSVLTVVVVFLMITMSLGGKKESVSSVLLRGKKDKCESKNAFILKPLCSFVIINNTHYSLMI